MGRIRILLADAHAVLRAGLRVLIDAQPDMEVVGEASSGAEVASRCLALGPDLVLMDLSMPGGGGIAAGASGYVLKQAADTELLAAIRTTARGETYLAPSLAGSVVQELLGRRSRKGQSETPALSERDQHVLRL